MYKKTAVLGTLHQKAVTYLDDKKSRESYINYRKQFQNAATFKKIYPYPIHVDIEIDNFCNFACTFCPSDFLGKVKITPTCFELVFNILCNS